MPSFLINPRDHVEILEADRSFDVEFEVWCGTCGAGLCGQSKADERVSYRGGHHVFVDVCQRCRETALQEGRDDAIIELTKEIDQLEQQIRNLESELDRLSPS